MIDSAKFDHAVSVLPAEEFYFRFKLARSGQCYAAAGLEESIIFKRQFNPYGALQPLGFCNPRDRNE